MPRAKTTTDVFNAIAEPRRREIIELLARQGSAMAVGAVVAAIGLAQPAVSKHLAVLHEVGIVSSVQDGRQRLYRLEAAELKCVFEWVSEFEKLWTHQLDRIKERAERRAREIAQAPPRPKPLEGQS